MTLYNKPDISGLRKRVQEEVFDERQPVTDSKNVQSASGFHPFLSSCKDSRFQNKSVCYIDSEIHEILKILKMRTGVPIGNLINRLTEEFINENMEEIKRLGTKNRYLI